MASASVEEDSDSDSDSDSDGEQDRVSAVQSLINSSLCILPARSFQLTSDLCLWGIRK